MSLSYRSHITGWLFAAIPFLSPCATAQSPTKSFEEFRASLKKDYKDFRNGILADYDKFLEGVWQDFEAFKGEVRDNRPKPDTAPVATPQPQPKPVPETKPKLKPKPKPKPTPQPKPLPEPKPESKPEPKRHDDSFEFEFYGVPVKAPEPAITLLQCAGRNDFAEQWRMLGKSQQIPAVIKSLTATAKAFRLNDYLTYELVAAYIGAGYGNASQHARHALAHYLLANMGYDVRLALTGDDSAVVLLALNEMVYRRPYLTIDKTKYHIFELGQPDGAQTPFGSISTCQLPAEADKGRHFDLIISDLNLPDNPTPFMLSGAGLKVEGITNGNIRQLLYRYPQMPMGDYARSTVLAPVREQIVTQLRAQLDSLSGRDAADRLLHFVQDITDYSTDDAYHGFEKPYFMEEMLIYPKSDCEDRAITYTYLLTHVLGLESHLIAYPGHESASVSLDDRKEGDAYEYEGKMFYISDPTYLGAVTGMCMPEYKDVVPQIDYHSKP